MEDKEIDKLDTKTDKIFILIFSWFWRFLFLIGGIIVGLNVFFFEVTQKQINICFLWFINLGLCALKETLVQYIDTNFKKKK